MFGNAFKVMKPYHRIFRVLNGNDGTLSFFFILAIILKLLVVHLPSYSIVFSRQITKMLRKLTIYITCVICVLTLYKYCILTHAICVIMILLHSYSILCTDKGTKIFPTSSVLLNVCPLQLYFIQYIESMMSLFV